MANGQDVMVRRLKRALFFRNKELKTLYELDNIRDTSSNINVYMKSVLKLIIETVRVKLGFALISDEDNQQLEVVVTNDRHVFKDHKLIQKIAADCVYRNQPIVINNTSAHSALRNYRVKDLVAIPLVLHNRILGAFVLMNKHAGRFSNFDLRLLNSIAMQSDSTIEALKLKVALEDKDKEIAKLYQLLYKNEAVRANTDQLTGLYNKRYFTDKFKELIEAGEKGQVFSAIMFDIDHFKQYNDTYGHPEGDKVLRDVAKTVMSQLGEKDMGFRYGGEEFIILLPGVELKSAIYLAEKIRKKIELLYDPARGDNRVVTVSIGVAQYERGESAEYFMDRVDKLAYESKETGRNRVTPMIEEFVF